MVCWIVIIAIQYARSAVEPLDALVLGTAGIVIAAIGWIDDHRGLSLPFRLVVQLVTATVTIVVIGAPSLLPPNLPATTFLEAVIGVLALTWMINLYNFMDGIDGLAGIEGVFAGAAMAGALVLPGAESPRADGRAGIDILS